MKLSQFQTTLLLIAILMCCGTYSFAKYQSAKWRAQNATVYLDNCKDGQNCEFQGTLRINIWTDTYHLEQQDGSELIFSKDAFAMISYPVPGDSQLRSIDKEE